MMFNALNRFVQRALVPVLLAHRAALALCSSSTRPFAAVQQQHQALCCCCM
jgi:hypothetical protein